MENTSNTFDRLDAGADHAKPFALVPPPPGEHEEQVLLKALNLIGQENQARARRRGKQPLLCFSVKLPISELNRIRIQAERWKFTQTDLARFLLQAVLPLLEAPTEAVRPVLDTILADQAAREEATKRRRQQHLVEFAS
jgi:hypothetical protein